MTTILLVDDQQIFRESVADALEDQGYEVLQASGGKEALVACENHPPDLLLVDIAMPEMDGMEFLRVLRGRPAMRQVPALFVTAFPREEYLEEAGRLGVGDFLVKSDVSLRDLLARIEKRLTASTSTRRPSDLPPEDESELTGADTIHRHLKPALRRHRPVCPRSSVRDLFELCVSPGAEVFQLAEIVMRDDEMERVLLQAASSGPFRTEVPVRRVLDAVDRLGFDRALRILSASAVVEGGSRGIPASGDMLRLWSHSMALALLNERLSPRGSYPTAAASFLAGMCAELPMVFAILALESDYAEFRARMWEKGVPVHAGLAEAFHTTPAHLALEAVREMELPECVWKPIVDRHSAHGGAQELWEPGPQAGVLEAASLFAVSMGLVWNPCLTVRNVPLQEAQLWRDSDRLSEDLPGIENRLTEMLHWDCILPGLSQRTQALPAPLDRTIRYLRSATLYVPDPLERILGSFGRLEICERPDQLMAGGDALRVAAVEPGSPLWSRLLELPRRTLLLHRLPAAPDLRLGPHAHLHLPTPVSAIERALRPR